MPKTMPGFCIARTFEGCEHGCGLWMDVSLCSGKIAVPGKVGECVRIHHLSPAREAGMAEGVQRERLHLGEYVRPRMLLLRRGLFDVAAPRWSRKDPLGFGRRFTIFE